MTKHTFVLVHEQARRRAYQCVKEAPDGWCVTISEPTRTLEQNSKLWPVLDCLAKQIVWHGANLSRDDWKDLLSAHLSKQRSAPALDGSGFVVFGERTRNYTKSMFSELIELAYYVGAQHNVDFNQR